MAKPRVLVTGGPTRAYLDELRFLSNLSTGELAFRLIKKLQKKAQVAAVIGPSSFDFASFGSKVRRIETNREMHSRVMRLCRDFRPDYVVFSAAVLDFEPVRVAKGKVSSSRKRWSIHLKPAPKIIDEVGTKFPSIKRIGFKLEAKKKSKAGAFGRKILEQKKLDALCLNFLPEIKNGLHPAYLFNGVEMARVQRKQQIVNWISSWIVKDFRRQL